MAMVEAHGTGTALGDLIEMSALVAMTSSSNASATAASSSAANACAVTGVKAAIGHTEPAAGMAGLLALTWYLSNAKISPNARLRATNPHVRQELDGSPIHLPAHVSSSSGNQAPRDRIGGVSSFGYSGTIALAR